MSIQQKNLWCVTCDNCGAETTIETLMDFSPTKTDLINQGFVCIVDVMPISYGQRVEKHYCKQCANNLMADKYCEEYSHELMTDKEG